MSQLSAVLETLSYARRFAGQLMVIKMGGRALQDDSILESVCADISALHAVGISVVLVHGGGPLINDELKARGVSWEFVDGQRVTTPEMVDVIEMVMCGKVNRKLVRALDKAGLPAVGFSGTDADTLCCRPFSPRLQLVGEVEQVNTSMIHAILDLKVRGGCSIPVIAPLGVGPGGRVYNINADWAACHIASALKVSKLLFLTDQDGILDHQGRLMPDLDSSELVYLINKGVVQGGMLAKTRTIIHALKTGIANVHILNAGKKHSLVGELFTNSGSGTLCRLQSRTKKYLDQSSVS